MATRRALTRAVGRRASSTLTPASTPAGSSSEPPLPVRPATSSIPPPKPSTTHRLVVSSLLARSPLVLPPLHPFERAYFAYQRDIRKSLERKPDSRFFFREGSKAEEGFRQKLEQDKGEVGKGKVQGAEVGGSSGPTGPDVEVGVRSGKGGRDEGELRSLGRKRDRTLYLMVKKARKDHSWQFRGSRHLPRARSRTPC